MFLVFKKKSSDTRSLHHVTSPFPEGSTIAFAFYFFYKSFLKKQKRWTSNSFTTGWTKKKIIYVAGNNCSSLTFGENILSLSKWPMLGLFRFYRFIYRRMKTVFTGNGGELKACTHFCKLIWQIHHKYSKYHMIVTDSMLDPEHSFICFERVRTSYHWLLEIISFLIRISKIISKS